MSAFAIGQANRGNTMKVFDWIKAAKLIKEHNIKNAQAGLESDFEYTAGTILVNGNPVESDSTYLVSTWATPQLEDFDGETYDCYIMDTPEENPNGWDEDTMWPKEALEILGKELLSD